MQWETCKTGVKGRHIVIGCDTSGWKFINLAGKRGMVYESKSVPPMSIQSIGLNTPAIVRWVKRASDTSRLMVLTSNFTDKSKSVFSYITHKDFNAPILVDQFGRALVYDQSKLEFLLEHNAINNLPLDILDGTYIVRKTCTNKTIPIPANTPYIEEKEGAYGWDRLSLSEEGTEYLDFAQLVSGIPIESITRHTSKPGGGQRQSGTGQGQWGAGKGIEEPGKEKPERGQTIEDADKKVYEGEQEQEGDKQEEPSNEPGDSGDKPEDSKDEPGDINDEPTYGKTEPEDSGDKPTDRKIEPEERAKLGDSGDKPEDTNSNLDEEKAKPTDYSINPDESRAKPEGLPVIPANTSNNPSKSEDKQDQPTSEASLTEMISNEISPDTAKIQESLSQQIDRNNNVVDESRREIADIGSDTFDKAVAPVFSIRDIDRPEAIGEEVTGIKSMCDVYEYVLYNADTWDRLTIPDAILYRFGNEIIKVIESNPDNSSRVDFAYLTLPKSRLRLTVLVHSSIENPLVQVQVLAICRRGVYRTDEEVLSEYYKWRHSRKYLS